MKKRFYSFSDLSIWNECGFLVLLVQPIGAFQSDVGRLEQVKLPLTTDVGLVSEDAAVTIQGLDILDIVNVMDTGL